MECPKRKSLKVHRKFHGNFTIRTSGHLVALEQCSPNFLQSRTPSDIQPPAMYVFHVAPTSPVRGTRLSRNTQGSHLNIPWVSTANVASSCLTVDQSGQTDQLTNQHYHPESQQHQQQKQQQQQQQQGRKQYIISTHFQSLRSNTA